MSVKINGYVHKTIYDMTTEEQMTMLHALLDKALTVADWLKQDDEVSYIEYEIIRKAFDVARNLHEATSNKEWAEAFKDMTDWEYEHIIY